MDHRLIKFLAVVEQNGFTNAAQATHITQPALTVAIRQLEKEYGTKLLYRSSGRFELTPTGQVVYDSACRMRNEQRAMRHQLATHEPHVSTLRLGLLDSVAALLLTKDEANEQLKEVWIDNSARLLKGLQLGRIDAAIITTDDELQETAHGLWCQSLHDEQFVFVGTAARIAAAGPKNIDDWLAFNQDSRTYAHFVRQFERLGIVATPTFFSTSMDLLKLLALQGRGVALLPKHFVGPELQSGHLREFAVPSLARPLYWVTLAGGHPRQFEQQLITRLDSRLRQSDANFAL